MRRRKVKVATKLFERGGASYEVTLLGVEPDHRRLRVRVDGVADPALADELSGAALDELGVGHLSRAREAGGTYVSDGPRGYEVVVVPVALES